MPADAASDFDEQPQHPYALGDELADSRYDQRHRLVASALFDAPIGEEEDRKPGDRPACRRHTAREFRRAIAAASARHIQFSLDFEF